MTELTSMAFSPYTLLRYLYACRTGAFRIKEFSDNFLHRTFVHNIHHLALLLCRYAVGVRWVRQGNLPGATFIRKNKQEALHSYRESEH